MEAARVQEMRTTAMAGRDEEKKKKRKSKRLEGHAEERVAN